MDQRKAEELLRQLLEDIATPSGTARTDDFAGLRQVDAKVREGKMILSRLAGFGAQLAKEMEGDEDFSKNSRRVRLEALANYCRTALRLLNAGAMKRERKKLYTSPDITELTQVLPELQPIIEDRWLEAQKCQHAGAYVAAIVMMGSILEGLLLARANLSPADAYQANAAPSKRDGSNVPLHDWSLNTLINVAAEVGWIKMDRKAFSHALRDSRNVVHPWHHVRVNADFDKDTCSMCWNVLKASVSDLSSSL